MKQVVAGQVLVLVQVEDVVVRNSKGYGGGGRQRQMHPTDT